MKSNSYKTLVGLLALCFSISAQSTVPAADQCNLVKMKVLILSKRLKDPSYTDDQKNRIRDQLVDAKHEYERVCVRSFR